MSEKAPTTTPTVWNAIVQARHLPVDHPLRRYCQTLLAEKYHGPVRVMMRQWGVRDEHDLDDEVQEFFLDFLEKTWLDALDREQGRLRGFLRKRIDFFLLTRKARSPRPMAPMPEDDLMASGDPSPGQAFDLAWGWQLVNDTLDEFRVDCQTRGLPHYWTVFERHMLHRSAKAPTLETTAELLSVTPKTAANHLHRARTRFRELLYQAVSRTMGGSEADIENELKELRNLLSKYPRFRGFVL